MEEKLLLAAAVAAALLAVRPAVADDAAPPAAAAASAWTLNAYAAASDYHSTGYPGGAAVAPGTSPVGLDVHAFDLEHDPLELDEAGLSLAYQPRQGFGALLDAIAGEDAKVLRQAEGGAATAFDIRQGFVQYAAGSLTMMAGKFLTCAGAEAINPTQNLNYSRSLLFTLSEPLTLTGVRAEYAASDTVSVDAGIDNGKNVTAIGHGWKSGEAGASWAPDKTFSLSLQSTFGELVPGGPQRRLVDVVLTSNVTSQLTLLASADWDRQGAQAAGAPGVPPTGGTWYGIAATVAYAFDTRWRLALRGEYLDDVDGFLTGTAGGQHLEEGTLTVGFKPLARLELRAEWRSDFSQAPVFLRQPALELYPYGTSPARMTGTLGEFALQAVYTFIGG